MEAQASRNYFITWAKYTILANAHLEALQPHCKDGKLSPENHQPSPHDASPSLTSRQPTAAHWSTAALDTVAAPEPTNPDPPASNVCNRLLLARAIHRGGGIIAKPQLRPRLSRTKQSPLGGVSCGAAPGEPGHIQFGIRMPTPMMIPS